MLPGGPVRHLGILGLAFSLKREPVYLKQGSYTLGCRHGWLSG